MAFGIRDLLATGPQATNAPTSFTGTLENMVGIVDKPRNPISFAGERVQPQLPVGQMRGRPQPARQMSRQELMEMLFSNYQNRSMEGFNQRSRGFNSKDTRFRR